MPKDQHYGDKLKGTHTQAPFSAFQFWSKKSNYFQGNRASDHSPLIMANNDSSLKKKDKRSIQDSMNPNRLITVVKDLEKLIKEKIKKLGEAKTLLSHVEFAMNEDKLSL